jgi:membrane associated rhomboid family serine protease
MTVSETILRKPWLAFAWAASLVLVWIAVALALKQPLLAEQHSHDLVRFGAFKGGAFQGRDPLRLLASQWLHVKFAHMLSNAVIIAVVGRAAAIRNGVLTPLAVGLLGGALGEVTAAVADPQAFVSGASQAAVTLCGLVLLTARIKSFDWAAAAVGTLFAFALDVFVSGHGQFKPGHIVSLIFGLMCGLVWRQQAKNHPL